MSTHELNELIERDFSTLVVDVQPRDSYEAEHIPGSVSIPVDAFDFVAKVYHESMGRGQRIVTYCHGPDCDGSRRAEALLTRAGFTNAQAFVGGIEQWKLEGHPITSATA